MAERMELDKVQTVHMLGIGGIGMSALARFLHKRGKVVTGYDKTRTPLTQALEEEGMEVYYEARPEMVDRADLVVYTPAVPKNFPEFARVAELDKPMMKRAQLLGMISRAYKTIAVAGTHGKTSTTGLIAHLLRTCGIDCTAFIGGITNNYGTNFLEGAGDWVVVEADEFDRSFLHLSPDIAVITSMDADHLDIYGEEAAVQESFRAFANCLKPGGTLFLHHALSVDELEGDRKLFTYGVEIGRLRSVELQHRGLVVSFDYQSSIAKFDRLRLNLPGTYNVENATAAISVAVALGCSAEGIRKGLESFTGIKRRFDIRYRTDEVVYIDDYAHHPTEIQAVLSAVRDMLPRHKVVAAFQPHLFSRTRDFHEGFAAALSKADAVVLLDIYPAREEPIPGVSSQMVFDRITLADKTLTNLEGLLPAIARHQGRPVVVLTIGAGDIDTQVEAVRQLVSRW
ncbi:MAG: UDP-N-acetylmuramate--L-alanine ligase [Bacteroidia bacterium]